MSDWTGDVEALSQQIERFQADHPHFDPDWSPTPRVIRYYATQDILSPPERTGRQAQYGYFHLVQDGKAVNGKWIRPQKDRWGELHGDATGNVMKFTWTEYTIGAIGKNAEKAGRGYLVYSRPSGENVDDKVDGELGRGNDEVGEKLAGVKQRNTNPDLGSIGGTGATDMNGGDWDGDSKEGGTPEPPALEKK